MEMKANLNEFSTELRIMIGAYKDFMTDRVMLSPEKGRSGELMRVVEVFLNHVSWRLTQPDGQLQIVNANLMNLRYINETMTDSSGVHSVEVGNFNMTNLMPNSPYKNVITPRGERRVGKDIAVRVYCRVKSPVGGIGVKDHFEVNLCPLNVALTHRLYTLMMGYFFPGRAHEYVRESVEEYDGPAYGAIEQQQHGDKEVFHEDSLSQKPSRPTSLAISEVSLNDPLRSRMSSSSLDSPSLTSPHGGDKKSGRSRFYANLSETASRELDKMKERAAQTNNFVYVKIPEVPICFSYKGEKEKNLVMDVHNFRLTLPTLQYQNRTWTWLDLMMTVKKDYKNVLVGQQPTGRKKKKKSLLSKFGLKQKCDKTDAVSFSGVSVGDQASFGLEEERFVPLSRSSDEEESSGVVQ
ncbi:Hypothetical predicted protein [Paramuricea clavata]|uniref:Uncharacterized protein n=1 Tax=Paramuricea clavata TaxID=317549 RepID=A0A7D9D9D5_PARCT|nr:Hypothetical predicted protein [Paramuricea clavata]